MIRVKSLLVLLCSVSALSLSGCTGSRNSYESLLDPNSVKPVIVLKVGEKREVLAVGNGFPGWWGYFPGIMSHDRSVASVDCEQERSLIPFREPGIVFGGERCYLEAKKAGAAWLFTGNKYTIKYDIKESDPDKLPEDMRFSKKPGTVDRIIKVKVMPDPGD